MSESRTDVAARETGHEKRDVSFGPVVIATVGVVAMVLLAALVMWVLYGFLGERESAKGASRNPLREEVRALPPEPRLQPLPVLDLIEMRRWEDDRLEGYDWVDRDAGVVRIPIDRAMRLVTRENEDGGDE